MGATTETEAGPPELETAEGFANFVSEALATRDQAVIAEAFATVTRTGGKSRDAREAAAPSESLDPTRERRAPEIPPRAVQSRIQVGDRGASPPEVPPRARTSERSSGGRARRTVWAGIVMLAALAAFCAGSLSLNAPERHPLPLSGIARRYAQSVPKAAPRATPESRTPASDDRTERLAAEHERLQARVRTLAAEVAQQTARFNELNAETGEAARQLSTLPAISAEIARETRMLDGLRARVREARQQLAALQAPHVPVHVVTATPRPAPGIEYSPAESLARQWRHEGAQLIAARGAITAGDTPEARQLIEAVQTQLVFQPVTPDDPIPLQSNNVAAGELGQALGLLDRGQAMLALRVLDRAIAELGA